MQLNNLSFKHEVSRYLELRFRGRETGTVVLCGIFTTHLQRLAGSQHKSIITKEKRDFHLIKNVMSLKLKLFYFFLIPNFLHPKHQTYFKYLVYLFLHYNYITTTNGLTKRMLNKMTPHNEKPLFIEKKIF